MPTDYYILIAPLYYFNSIKKVHMFKSKYIISYVITFAVMSLVIPWTTALIIMLGISVHEIGHLYFGRRYGLKTGGFILMPFVGGVSFISGQFSNAFQRSIMLIGGPLFGSLLGVPFLALYLLSGNIYCGQVAMLFFLFNLFNLLPFSFMDGGQLMECWIGSINEKAAMISSVVSYVVAIPIILYLNPILAVIIAIVGFNSLLALYNNYLSRQSLRKMNLSEEEINATIHRPKAMSKVSLFKVATIYSTLGLSLIVAILFLGLHNISYSALLSK